MRNRGWRFFGSRFHSGSVRKIPAIDAASATVERLTEDGIDTLRLSLPAVLAVTKEINEPRLPSLKGKMAAKKAAIPTWGKSELPLEAGLVGSASASAVARTTPVPKRSSGTLVTGATAEEKARNLVQKLKEAKLI